MDSSITVYDMRGSFPQSFTVPLNADGEASLSLSDVLPAECMLVQLADNKDNITAAVESIVASVCDFFCVKDVDNVSIMCIISP